MKNASFGLLIFILISCCFEVSANHFSNLRQVFRDSTPALPEKPGPNQTYAYITGIQVKKGGKVMIDANYIDLFTGEDAISQAKKRREAIAETDSAGNKKYFVPNGYFIVDESKAVRKLQLHKKVAFDLSANETIDKKVPNTFDSFKQVYKLSLFLITLRGKDVMHLKQIYLP